MKQDPGYRPDIDGLRALAIVPVVLFHIGAPGSGGGFVGVDVFFVISGFLITRILRRDLDAGGFSLVDFWLRRARRLLPTLAVVIAATVLAGFLFLEGGEVRRLGRQCVMVSGFLGNVWAYRNVADYWGAGSGEFHLLHCWSLAVEEQFYLVFPPLLVLLRRRSRHPDRWLLGMALLSFALCLPGAWRNAAACFYLPHGRAWELLVGALLALRPPGGKGFPGLVGDPGWMGGIGVGLLILGFSVVREGTYFPGPLGLLPTLGTALVLAGGPSGRVNRWLATPLLVYIGRISYGWYLWHWPVLLFLRKSGIEENWSTFGFSLGLASLSYHALEQPTRRIPVPAVPLRVVVPAVLGFVLCCAIPRFVRHPVERVPAPLTWCDADLMPRTKIHEPWCVPSGLVRSPQGPFVPATPIAPGPIHALVVGDSHGRSLLPALDAAFRELQWNYAAFTASGARPLVIIPGRPLSDYVGNCWDGPSRQELDRSIRSFLAATSPPVVIVVGRWSSEAASGRKAFREDVEHLRALAPASTFLFVGQAPELAFGVGGFYTGELELPRVTSAGEPWRAARDRTRVHGWLREIANDDPRVQFVEIAHLYQKGPGVRFRDGATLLYFDDDHLTVAGAALAEPLLRETLRSLAVESTHPVRLPGR